MRSSHNRIPEILALSTTLAVTGCTTTEIDQIQPTPSASSTEAANPFKYFEANSLYDPCDPGVLRDTFFDASYKLEKATACASIYKVGKVALVNYDVSSSVAQKLATRTEDIIGAATNGEITLDISVVEPSQAARDAFKEANPDNCIDLNQAERYGSAIANLAMPNELDTSDYVVGLTSATDCDSDKPFIGKKGVSSPFLGGRFLEVLNADPAESHPVGRGFIDDALILSHELMHNLGLGHAGDITFANEENPLRSITPSYEPFIELDLDAMIAQGRYEEYGDYVNTQGNSATSFSDEEVSSKSLNAIQRERLHWPTYIASPETPRKEQSITNIDTLLNTSDPDTFASVELTTPIQLTAAGEGEVVTGPPTHKFTKLAVVASEVTMQFQEGKTGVDYRTELFLTNDEGDTVRLGYADDTTTDWTFHIGGKVVSLNYSEAGLSAIALDK